MNILIVKLSAIGDVIHTLPSLVALRRLYPTAHITWVVEEAAADLVKNHPCLDEVLISRRKSWANDFKNGEFPRPYQEIRFFLKQLRARSYDLVIDFHGLLKSSVIVYLSRGKRKLGYDSWQELSGLFINEKIHEDMNKHAVDRYLDFLRYLGASTDNVEFILPLTDDTKTKAQQLLEKYHLTEKQYIAINPIAYWETKLWNNEKFAKLGDLIKERLKLDVVFTGSDKASADNITSRMTMEGINLGGETKLLELAEIYKRASAVITTDSGPMHLAAAVGTPVIALFGPTDPARTGPYGKGHAIIQAKLPCSPCLLKKCSTTKCMADILPQHVFAATNKILAKV